MEECVIPIFKLSDLAHMYKVCLAQLGADIEGGVDTTRLNIRILSVLPDLGAYCSGEMYFSHSLLILVMFLGRHVIMIVTQCI